MKFTIRDLFLVTLIVALALGWWVDRSRQSAWKKHAEIWRARAEEAKRAYELLDGSEQKWADWPEALPELPDPPRSPASP